MEMRFSGLLCLLFLFITVEFVMYTEAIILCKSRSREYKGSCINRNCNLICRHETFEYGKCLRTTVMGTKCYCYKPCHGGSPGGGGEDPPAGPGGGGGSGGPPPSDDPPAAGPGGDDTPPTGPGATRECKARSREYKGRCTNSNCAIICKHEKFVYGKCIRTTVTASKCYCYKPCANELAGSGD